MKWCLTILLLLFAVEAWAQDLTPSINTTSYVCGADGSWDDGYCWDMLDIVEQYIGWSDGSLNCSTDPDWADSVRAHGAGIRMYNYATIKGAWAQRYGDTSGYSVGRLLFFPATMLYNICARRWPDSAGNMYERLHEHYQDSVVFIHGANYVLCPPADEDADGLIEAVDSCARVIYYINEYAYSAEEVGYRGTTCKKATGKGRVLYAMNEPWQREVIAEYFQFACTTTSVTFYCDGGPPYDIYLDNADHGNSQVRGRQDDASGDQLGSIASSWEAPDDSNDIATGDDCNWSPWKHQQMMITLQVIRDSVESIGHRLSINVVYGTPLSYYYDVDTGSGNLFNPARIQLNEERMGSYGIMTANNYAGLYLPTRVADIESCAAKNIPVNWDSWNIVYTGTASTEPTVPTGFTGIAEYMNYNSMCAYYLAKPQATADDTLFWMSFNVSSCSVCDPVTLWSGGHWSDAMGIDVGVPDAPMFTAYTGPCDDGVARGVEPDLTRIFRRDYNDTGFMVLYQPCWEYSDHPYNVLGDSVYVTYDPLDVDTMWMLLGDGTYSDPMLSVDLPIGCGVVLLTSGSNGYVPEESGVTAVVFGGTGADSSLLDDGFISYFEQDSLYGIDTLGNYLRMYAHNDVYPPPLHVSLLIPDLTTLRAIDDTLDRAVWYGYFPSGQVSAGDYFTAYCLETDITWDNVTFPSRNRPKSGSYWAGGGDFSYLDLAGGDDTADFDMNISMPCSDSLVITGLMQKLKDSTTYEGIVFWMQDDDAYNYIYSRQVEHPDTPDSIVVWYSADETTSRKVRVRR
jgi:hypothetical protein